MNRFLVITFVLVSYTGIGQVNYDSLWSVWNNTALSDSNRISAINELAYEGHLYTNPDSAFALAETQIQYSRSKNVISGILSAKNTQGIASFMLGDIRGAIPYFDTCRIISESIGDLEGVSSGYNNVGLAYRELGNLYLGIEYFKKSLKIDRQRDDELGIGVAHYNIGVSYHYISDLKSARQHYEKGIKYATKVGDYSTVGSCLAAIGEIHTDQGEYNLSIKYAKEALQIAEEIQDPIGMSLAYNGLGLANSYTKNFRNAVSCFKQALQIDSLIEDIQSMPTAMENIGNAYRDMAVYDSARYYYDFALNLRNEIGVVRGITASLYNMGGLEHDLGNYYTAIEFYKRAIALQTEVDEYDGLNSSYSSLSATYSDLALYLSCVDSINKANKILEYAEVYADSALIVSTQLGKNKEHHYALRAAFRAKDGLNKGKAASSYIEELMADRRSQLNDNFFVMSELEKEMYFMAMINDQEMMLRYVANNYNNDKDLGALCFNNIVRTKGLLLKSSSSLYYKIRTSQDSSLVHLYDDWLTLKRNLSQQYGLEEEDYKLLLNRISIVEKEMINKALDSDDLNSELDVDFKALQKKMSKSQVVVEFGMYPLNDSCGNQIDKQYIAVILTKKSDKPVIVKICTESELTAIMGKAHGTGYAYINKLYSSSAEDNGSLYDLIWRDVEPFVEGYSELIISPIGLLHKISFSALSPNKNTYLCQQYSIKTTGGSSNAINSTSKIELSSIRLYGGIDYSSDSETQEWKYLPGTLKEVNEIESALKELENVTIKSGIEASESDFRQSSNNSRIIHIATHGFFFPNPDDLVQLTKTETISEDIAFRGANDVTGADILVKNVNPLMRSGIVLANANKNWSSLETSVENDGVLTAQDISTMNLSNVELAVLSACETGLGDIKGTEGVYGLQRAFKLAGVKNLIMSLWQVPDKETSEFMSLFYKNLNKTNNIQSAFSMTQKEMQKKYDPYYWAAFVLVQ